MREAPTTIVLDGPPEAEVVLSTVGPVTVRANGRRPERELAWRATRPLAADYRAFTNVVLAAATEQHLSPTLIDELPDRDRRGLMLAVVRLRGEERQWRALYGSPLSADERLFAVMLWSWQRERRELRWRLRRANERRLEVLKLPAGTMLPAVAGTRSTNPYVGAGYLKALTRAIALPKLGFLGGAAFSERLYDSSGVMAAFKGTDKLALSGLQVSDIVRSAGFAGRWSSSAGLAGLASSLRYRGTVSPSLAEQLRASVAPLGLSAAARDALANSFAASTLTGGALAGWRLNHSSVLGSSRIPAQLAEALGGSWRTGYTGPLVQSEVIAQALGAFRMPTFDVASHFRGLFDGVRDSRDALAELGEFMRVWETDPLWFLLSVCGMRATRQLIGLTREQVEEALLSALADVMREGDYVEALREVVREAPYLTRNQRLWLDQGLEHAADGEWVKAVPPLLAGLEGALHRGAVERSLIAERRGKFIAAEELVKRMALDPDYTAFVVRHVFGGIGNAFRHGRADSGERDQVLFAIVALAGWVDFFLALNAMDALADELFRHLDAAVERVTRELPALPVLT